VGCVVGIVLAFTKGWICQAQPNSDHPSAGLPPAKQGRGPHPLHIMAAVPHCFSAHNAAAVPRQVPWATVTQIKTALGARSHALSRSHSTVATWPTCLLEQDGCGTICLTLAQ
jgi:hypothetical protein